MARGSLVRAALLAISLGTLVCAPVARAASPSDVAATRAYALDALRLDRALASDAGAAASAGSNFAADVGRECRGVLKGAPVEGPGPEGGANPTARQRGERARAEHQSSSIEEEIGIAFVAAADAPFHGAFGAFRAAVSTLTWSDTRIAPLVRFEAALYDAYPLLPSTSLCADLRVWAASGFGVLSPGTRQFVEAQEHLAGPPPPTNVSLATLLKPSESRATRRIETQIKKVGDALLRAEEAIFKSRNVLKRDLGTPKTPIEERESEPVIGRVRTAAGDTVVVRRESARFRSGACKRSVSVEFKERSKQRGLRFSGSQTSDLCMSERPRLRPGVSCGEGNETLSIALPASVRSVRLLLSDGRKLTSPTIDVPRRYGGPGAVYAQTLRGYKPYPVSLTELSASGAAVGVLKLPAGGRCKREPSHFSGPRFVPLVHANTPQGVPFSIEGVFLRFGPHRTDFSIELRGGEEADGEERSSSGPGPAKAFAPSLSVGCPPHAYWIVYGMLSPPGGSVLARTAQGLTTLTQVAIAANFKPEGPLEYGVFATPPLELIVRRADGSTLYTESLGTKVTEETEFCDGYAEP